jgi:LmbE family N-acetylglucosaminyl deacetylase
VKNVAIIVPHGDDEVLGFTGAILRHKKQGDNITVIFIRSANPNDKRSELQLQHTVDAQKILDYQNIEFLHMPEVMISDNPLVLFRAIEALISRIKPDVVYTTFWGDNHQDHQICFECVSRAIRVWGVHRVKEYYAGEIASSTDQSLKLPNRIFAPNIYMPMSRDEFKIKVKALQCYSGEIVEYPHPRSPEGIEILAKQRGIECGSEYAEAYMCLRNILS